MFTDTSVVLPGTVRDQDGNVVFVVGQTHQLAISAVDSNYYDYYRTASDEFTGTGVINRLHGALGVFGSIVPLMSRTIVVQ